MARSGATEVNLETEEFKITIKTSGQMVYAEAPAQAQLPPVQATNAAVLTTAAPQATLETEKPKNEEDHSRYVTIKSPMIGTMYRRPSPDKEPFVSVGSMVKTGDVVCVIEAMKLFNEIESEVSGKIVKILVDDQTPVEYDQPLFLVDPA